MSDQDQTADETPTGWCGTPSHPMEAHERRRSCIAFTAT